MNFKINDTIACPICNQKIKVGDERFGRYDRKIICKECHDALQNNDVDIDNLDKYTLKELKIKANIINENSKIVKEEIKESNNVNIEQKESPFKDKCKEFYNYVVLQIVLRESFIGTGSANLTELEDVINRQAKKGYRLHTISTTSSGSKGLLGGDRIQATLVFEKLT